MAQPLGFFHEMRGEQQCFAAQGELPQTLPNDMARLWVKPGSGLIQKQQIWVVNQRARQCQPPLHAAGKCADAGVTATGQARIFQQIGNALFEFGVRDIKITTIHQQVFAHRKIGVKVIQLRHHACARACFARPRGHRAIEQRNAAAVGQRQAQRETQRGGFARAIGAEQAKTFAGRKVKIHTGDGCFARVRLAQAAH